MDSVSRSIGPDRRLRAKLRCETDVSALRRKVNLLLRERCSPEEAAEILTAILELAENALRYAGSGDLSLQVEGDTVTVACEDHGPGILHWDMKKYDVLERKDSLGFGLGVVSRLMDTVDIHTEAGNGTRVVVTRQLGVRTGPPPCSTEGPRLKRTKAK